MVSTPHRDEAAMCNRLALIQSGRILSVNLPAQIIDNYPYELYRAKADNNYHLLEKLKVQDNIRLVYISGEFLHLVFKDKDMRIDYPDVELKRTTPNIEDCFIQLMQMKS